MNASIALAARRCGVRLGQDVIATLRAHLWLIALAEIYIIVAYGVALLLGRPGSFSFLGYERAFAIATPIV